MHQTARWVAPRNNNTVRSAGCVGPAGVLRSRRNTSCHARTTPCDYCRAQHRGVAECDGTGHAVLSVDEHKPNQLPCPMATGTGSQGMDLDWTRYPIEWEEDYMSGRLRLLGDGTPRLLDGTNGQRCVLSICLMWGRLCSCWTHPWAIPPDHGAPNQVAPGGQQPRQQL